MGRFYDVISGIGLLILVFLFLNNGDRTVNIISQLGKSGVNTIRTLQGLDANMY
jgi:anaerobic C4-dicarboxylate transporter